jgi:hypothetical protein
LDQVHKVEVHEVDVGGLEAIEAPKQFLVLALDLVGLLETFNHFLADVVCRQLNVLRLTKGFIGGAGVLDDLEVLAFAVVVEPVGHLHHLEAGQGGQSFLLSPGGVGVVDVVEEPFLEVHEFLLTYEFIVEHGLGDARPKGGWFLVHVHSVGRSS